MIRAIALFELRQQWRGHVFWVVLLISTAMVLGSVGVDELRVGVEVGGARNGAEAVVRTHLVWTLFFLFTNAALVADALLRDELTGFAPIVRATPVSATAMLFGRFLGAFAGVLLCFVSVPAGLLLGSVMPWVDPATLVPQQWSALAFALFVIAVPNLLLSAAFGFALATLGRSMAAALIGAIVLLIGYGLGAQGGAVLPPLLEPFGIAAYDRAIRGWSVAARDLTVPWHDGMLLANRALALLAAVMLLGATARLFTVRTPAPSPPGMPPAESRPEGASQTALRVSSIFDTATTLRQLIVRTRFEAAEVLHAPVFAVLVLLGTANAAATLWTLPPQSGGRSAVAALGTAYRLLPIVISLFFAGEIWWRERERGVAAWLGAAPMAAPVFLLPKMLALFGILLAVAVSGAGVALLIARVPGHAAIASTLLADWFLSSLWDWLLFAVLALFLQSLAPNKLAGWGFTVLFLIASLALEKLGYTDPAYRYARVPGPEVGGAIFYRLYWTATAAVLAIIALTRGRPALGRPANRLGLSRMAEG